MTRIAIVLLAVAAGCGSKDSQQRACKAQVDDLMAFLRAMDHTQSPFFVDDVELVMRPDLRVHDVIYGPSITIKPDAVLYEGQPIALDDLAIEMKVARGELDEAAAMHRRPESDADPARIYLVIDARAPWDRIVRVAIAAAGEGFTKVGFVFGRRSPVEPPPRSSVDDKLDAIMHEDPSERVTGVAGIARDVVQSCPALIHVFGSVAVVDDKAKSLIEGTGPAVLACDCHLDLPALRSVMWRIVGNPHPTVTLDVTLSSEATAVALPADTPWREASARIQAGATLWPVVPVPPPPLPKHR